MTGTPTVPPRSDVRIDWTRPARKKRLAPKGAPPKGGKVVSKQQQKWSFATKQPWAHAAAKEGAAYKALPKRKRKSR